MSNNSNRQQRNVPQGLRTSEKQDKDSFVVSKSLKDILTIILLLNFVNIILFNTGWIDFKMDVFDIVWGTALGVLNLIYPIIFNSVKK